MLHVSGILIWSGNVKVKYIILIFKDWRDTRLKEVICNNTEKIVVVGMESHG